MFTPPVNSSDRRILGIGSSKMVWRIQPIDDFAVINAFDRQRTDGLPDHWTLKEKIRHNNSKIQREFNFTQHVKTIFGDLIPEVSTFKRGEMVEDGRFRYKKELCEPVVNSDELFYEMVRIAEEVIEKGWVYLDMKPANLGRRGRLCIIDTDPKSFYPFPPEHKQYYLISSYMIILLVSKNYLPYISETTLVQFILDKQLTYANFRKTYDTEPPLDTITQYGNGLSPESIHVSSVMHPRAFFDAYDGKEGAVYSLFRLTHLSTHPPFLAAMAEVQATSRAAQVQPENHVLKAAVQVAQAFATTITKQVEMERGIDTAEKAAHEANEARSLSRTARRSDFERVKKEETYYVNEAAWADTYARSCVKQHASAIQLLSVAQAEYEAAQDTEQRRLNAIDEEQRRLNAIEDEPYPYLKNENNYTSKLGRGKSKGKGTGKGTGKGKKGRVDRSRAKPSRFKRTSKNRISPI